MVISISGLIQCSLYDRCLRFAIDVTVDPARLASDVDKLLPSLVGLSPWVTFEVFRRYLLSLQPGFLAHRSSESTAVTLAQTPISEINF
jgi:hypothetical protein